MLISLLEVCQEWGVKKGETWRMLRVPDWRLGGQCHPWCHGWCCFTLKKIPWKFCVDIFMGSVSGRGGSRRGYLEDVEGSWPETWRTGSSLALWMYLVDPKDHILNVSVSLSLFLADILGCVTMVTKTWHNTYIQTYRHSSNLFKMARAKIKRCFIRERRGVRKV